MGVFQQKYHISDTENLRVTKNDAKEDGCFLSKNTATYSEFPNHLFLQQLQI